MKKIKILIAGGAGYIGTRLASELIRQNYDVTVIDFLWFGNHLPKGVKVIRGDIFDLSEKFLKNFARVIFLAGLSNDPMADYSPALNFIHNASSPTYLAYMAKKAGVPRFIYASSCSVYGNSGNKLNKETAHARSLYPYGLSKLQGEFAADAIMDNDFSVICLRQGTVSGFSPRMRFDLVVNAMYMHAMTEGKIVVDNPNIWRPILAMSDAITAYVRAIEAKPSIRGIFNISSGNFTVGKIASIVKEYFRKYHNIDLEVQTNSAPNFRNYRVTTRKSQKVLGMEFSGSIQSILKELDNSIGKNFDFGKDGYYNIKVFKKILDNKNISNI